MTIALPTPPARRRERMTPLTGPARMLLHPDVDTTAAELRDEIHARGLRRQARQATSPSGVPTGDTHREVSTGQAAKILGKHRSTILRWARTGRIRARRIGLYWRITVELAHGLTELAAAVLHFAAHRLPYMLRDGREYDTVRRELGVDMVRFGQILTHTLQDPRALLVDGAAVMRLRRDQEQRTIRRGLPRRRLENR
jgi:excisionase family DNA binding protein